MAYAYYRPIVVDHTKVPNTDQTNFPVPVNGTFSYLATQANGGKVTNANGYDIAFFSNPSLTVKLNYERVIYNAVTGKVSFYVQVPTVSHTVNTTIYMAYGDFTISTDQSNVVATWDANFVGVYHFGDGTTLSLNDSTGSVNTLTNIASATAVAGPFGGAVSLNGTSQYLRRLTNALVSAAPMTYSVLFYPTGTANRKLIGQGQQASNANTISAEFFGSKFETLAAPNFADSIANCSTNAWNYGASRFITASNIFTHLSGAAGVNGTTAATLATPDCLSVGADYSNGVASNFFPGSIAEVRISNIDRGSDWVTTEYNSLLLTFVTLGAEYNSNDQPPISRPPQFNIPGSPFYLRAHRAYSSPGNAYLQTLSGTITPTGAITTATVYLQAISGTITPAGALSTLYKSGAAIIGQYPSTPPQWQIPSSPFYRRTTFTVVNTASNSYTQSISGSITPSGILSTTTHYLLSLAGSITPAGALTTTKNILIVLGNKFSGWFRRRLH